MAVRKKGFHVPRLEPGIPQFGFKLFEGLVNVSRHRRANTTQPKEMKMQPFAGQSNATVNINVSGTTQAVKVSDSRTGQVRVMNDGTATAWIAFGTSGIETTASTGMPIGPGVTEVLTVPLFDGSPIYVAAIAASTTGRIYFTPGLGI